MHRRRLFPAEVYFALGFVFLALVVLSHSLVLNMPYFWDEAGQFIPATFDLYRHLDLVPTSVTPNVHPPGVMAYLALVWSLLWPAPEVTRVAMLLVGTATLLAVFALGIELCGSIPGTPALMGVALFGLTPLFYTQSMLAQLDLPATLFTCLGLYWFLKDKTVASAAACTLLVLVKETGALLPVVLLLVLWNERRRGAALLYVVPLAALSAWLVFLRAKTGHILGSAEFAHYNVTYAMDPMRLVMAVVRRVSFFGLEYAHFLAWIAIYAAYRAGWFAQRRWRVAGLFAVAHVLAVTLLGGAELERYLLPALPIFYMAAATGFHAMEGTRRWVLSGILAVALLASLFISNPLWPIPYENNLEMVDSVRVQQSVARYLLRQHYNDTITTAWPLSVALNQPDLGYLTDPFPVKQSVSFAAEQFRELKPEQMAVFVLYSRDSNPPLNLLENRYLYWISHTVLGWRTPIKRMEIEERFGLRREVRIEQGDQWAEIYARPQPADSAK